jgi:hypothetical protein
MAAGARAQGRVVGPEKRPSTDDEARSAALLWLALCLHNDW